jgi:hypothetical protein
MGMGDGGGCGGLSRSSWISRRNLNLGLVRSGLALPVRKFPLRPTFLPLPACRRQLHPLHLRRDSCPPNSRGGIQNKIKIKTTCKPRPRHQDQNMPASIHKRVVAHRDRPTAAFHISRRPAALRRPQTVPRPPAPGPSKTWSPDAETRSSPTRQPQAERRHLGLCHWLQFKDFAPRGICLDASPIHHVVLGLGGDASPCSSHLAPTACVCFMSKALCRDLEAADCR